MAFDRRNGGLSEMVGNKVAKSLGGLLHRPPDVDVETEPPPLVGDSPVETRPLSAVSVGLLVLMVIFEIGLFVGIGNAVVHGWGAEVPAGWARWPVWTLFALLFGAALWLYAWWLFHGGTVLTTREVRDRDWLEGGRRLLLEDAESITLRTANGPRELVINGPGRLRFAFRDGDAAWEGAVANLRAWVACRPELAADESVRALLR